MTIIVFHFKNFKFLTDDYGAIISVTYCFTSFKLLYFWPWHVNILNKRNRLINSLNSCLVTMGVFHWQLLISNFYFRLHFFYKSPNRIQIIGYIGNYWIFRMTLSVTRMETTKYSEYNSIGKRWFITYIFANRIENVENEK